MSGNFSEQETTRVYVGGLNENIKKEDLEKEFDKYGKLNNIWVAFNPPGFAFIEFENQNEAEAACEVLNGIEILGSKLRVEISRRRSRGRGGPRGGVGGRGGGGGFRGNFREGGGGGNFRGGRGGVGGDRGGRGRGSFNREPYGNSRGGGAGGYGGVKREGGFRNEGGDGFASRGFNPGRQQASRFRSRSPVIRGSQKTKCDTIEATHR